MTVSPKQFDHILNVKITSQMRRNIDSALPCLKIPTRSEFIRLAVDYALASLHEYDDVDLDGAEMGIGENLG